MLIHIILGHATFAVAYPSSINPTGKSKPVSDMQSQEVKSVQPLSGEFCHAGIGPLTNDLEALDAVRAKILPSPVEDISSFLLNYAETGVEGTWNTTVKQTKALLDSLTGIITQNDSHVLDPDTKIKLHDLSTTFLDLLPPTIPAQAHSKAIEINSADPTPLPIQFNTSLSSNATSFMISQAGILILIPYLSLLALSGLYNPSVGGGARFSTELSKYMSEIELIQAARLNTSAPVPFSGRQCASGVPDVLVEMARKPEATNKFLRVAVADALYAVLGGIFSGLIFIGFYSGIEGVLRNTHEELREWPALLNGDPSSCKRFTMPNGEGRGG
jgi:hypothetical protein